MKEQILNQLIEELKNRKALWNGDSQFESGARYGLADAIEIAELMFFNP